jgi:hypothetical protein
MFFAAGSLTQGASGSVNTNQLRLAVSGNASLTGNNNIWNLWGNVGNGLAFKSYYTYLGNFTDELRVWSGNLSVTADGSATLQNVVVDSGNASFSTGALYLVGAPASSLSVSGDVSLRTDLFATLVVDAAPITATGFIDLAPRSASRNVLLSSQNGFANPDYGYSDNSRPALIVHQDEWALLNAPTVKISAGASGGNLTFVDGDTVITVPGITVPGSITRLELAAPAGTISQTANNPVTPTLGEKTGLDYAGNLVLSAGGAITLDATTNVIPGGTNGVTVTGAGGEVTLKTTGALKLGNIAAGSQYVTLDAGGAVTQYGGSAITTASLDVGTTAGSITLTEAGNQIAAISATTPASFTFTQAGAILGTYQAYGGATLTSTLSSVTVIQPGDFTLTSSHVYNAGTDILVSALHDLTLVDASGLHPAVGGSSIVSASHDLIVPGIISSNESLSLGAGNLLSLTSGSSVTVYGGSLTLGGSQVSLDNATATAAANSVLVSAGSLNLSNGAVIEAGTGLVVTAGTIELASGSQLLAANNALVTATTSVTLTDSSSLVATSGNAIVEVGSNLTLENGSYIKAGIDAELVLKGPTSVLTLNSVTAAPSYIWALSPHTIYLDFPLLASGGVVIDGKETIKTVTGGAGFFAGPLQTPATEGFGLKLGYGVSKGGDSSVVTTDLLRAVLNAVPAEQLTPEERAKKDEEEERKKREDEQFGEKDEKDNRPSKRLATCT